MLTTKQACELARALPNVSEQDHFGSDAFRTEHGIFATVWHEKASVNLRLTPEQQREFVMQDGEGFREIDNAWGRQGWTTAHLEFLEARDFTAALRVAYENRLSAPPRKKRPAKKGTAR